MKSQVIASLDIGTASVKVIMAEIIKGQLNVVSVGHVPSQGVSNGRIVSIDKASESVREAVAQAEQKAGIKIEEVVVGITAHDLEISPSHGKMKINKENKEIDSEDILNLIANMAEEIVPEDYQLLSVQIEEFILDGFGDIKEPRSMVGTELEFYGHFYSLPKTIFHSLKKTVEKAGLTIRQIVLQPLANAYAALSENQRESGAIIIDMGAGQTTAAAIHDNLLKFAIVDPEAGDLISSDIAIVLNSSKNKAQDLKHKFGFASPLVIEEVQKISYDDKDTQEVILIEDDYLAEIIEARLMQIFETIRPPLLEIEAFSLPGGIVMSGGTTSLAGIQELAEEMLGYPVSSYVPDYMGVRYPVFSTAIGQIEYVARQDSLTALINSSLHQPLDGVKDKVGIQEAQVMSFNQNQDSNASKAEREVEKKKAPQSGQNKKTQAKEDGFFSKISVYMKGFFDIEEE